MKRHYITAFVLTIALVVSWITVGSSQTQNPASSPAATPPPTKNDYSKADSWLCRPGRKDACAVDMTATVVAANGKLARENWVADPKAPIDCFYVYPTVSNDTTPNSDMVAGTEELNVIRAQAARFGAQCRVFAPLYRQVTLTALRSFLAGKQVAIDRNLAYNDVLDAWNYYLAHDNNGRGVVLIGHSQGSMVLTQLIRNEIDGKPLQSRIVSALLLGTNLPVPRGKDVGGAFQQMRLCHSADQVGCVITYASFRATSPPPANSRFGKVTGDNMVAACTNPAALTGGSGPLRAYLGSRGSGVTNAEVVQKAWLNPPQTIATPFVTLPGLLTAECVQNEKGSYLAVTVHGDPADPRTDDITGDVVANGQVLADWGFHLIDVSVAMGNLLDIVHEQSKAYRAASKTSSNR
jgi:hypothetical protein